MFSVLSTLLNSPLPDSVRKKKEEEDRKVAGELRFLHVTSHGEKADL
jgi:hypothetical protein